MKKQYCLGILAVVLLISGLAFFPYKEEETQTASVEFMAVGDNLIHENIYKQARTKDGYDFSPMYQHVRPTLEQAELSLLNQESIVAEGAAPLSGYPRFNSPKAVADAVKSLGFDVVNLANNHILDQGQKGLAKTLELWEKQGVLPIGVWQGEPEPVLYEKNGITFGFVAFTQHTNGLTLPADSPYDFLRGEELEQLRGQMERTRKACDFLMVSAHWGEENTYQPTKEQRELAQLLADWGADLVVGHHSHTLQPIEWRRGKKGNPTLVAYSLGNFLSSMEQPQNMVGGILDVNITMKGKKASIAQARLLPVITHYETKYRKNVQVYPLSAYSETLLERHGIREEHPEFTGEYIRGILEDTIPKAFWEEKES